MKTIVIAQDITPNYISNPKTESIMTKIINSIAAAFRNWKAGRKEAQSLARTRDLQSRFRIVERGGNIFLTVDGVAFQQITEGQTARQIVAELKEAQQSAVILDVYKNR